MQKNKTHRIISISPTSQNSSIRSTQNKTTTPIKPIQHPTRTNTIKTNIKPEDNQLLDSSCQTAQRNNVQSVFVSSYKDEGTKPRRDSFKIDEILNRIGQTYEGEKANASTQLIKKTQISYLRQFIRQAKNIVKLREQNEGSSSPLSPGSNAQIQAISSSIRTEISTFFSNLHKELYTKENSVYEELEEKIFELKEKNITKCYQIASLKNYIEKCEADINSNYEGIINDIQIKQLNQIVNSYTKRLEFYTDKVKSNEFLKIDLPTTFSLLKNIPNIHITIQREEDDPVVQHNSQPEAFEFESKISSVKVPNIPINLGQISKLSFDKRVNVRSALEEVQNFPLAKLVKKKINNTNEHEPRIASARGKY